ncbi:hypothetical protein CDL12_23495 [Handroanthus impetiginosus]|uniref:Uncharacterized protein n=1 Tax=Handroanthus impetiginosus TaxID=429701 RepID=A0A2G9GFB1_9LAMI|nr:hypothetical protein CDL12_23495 [Handroanthus impetiginosus]
MGCGESKHAVATANTLTKSKSKSKNVENNPPGNEETVEAINHDVKGKVDGDDAVEGKGKEGKDGEDDKNEEKEKIAGKDLKVDEGKEVAPVEETESSATAEEEKTPAAAATANVTTDVKAN